MLSWAIAKLQLAVLPLTLLHMLTFPCCMQLGQLAIVAKESKANTRSMCALWCSPGVSDANTCAIDALLRGDVWVVVG